MIPDTAVIEDTVADIQRRIYGARRDLLRTGIETRQFAIHLSPDLWQWVFWRYGHVCDATGRIRLFDMDSFPDAALPDDQIRLRVEVVA